MKIDLRDEDCVFPILCAAYRLLSLPAGESHSFDNVHIATALLRVGMAAQFGENEDGPGEFLRALEGKPKKVKNER